MIVQNCDSQCDSVISSRPVLVMNSVRKMGDIKLYRHWKKFKQNSMDRLIPNLNLFMMFENLKYENEVSW